MDYKHFILSNKVRQVLFLLTIIVLGYILLNQMTFMLGGFLGAVALYMILRKPMFKLTYEYKWNKSIAATLLMVSSFLAIGLPFAWIAYILADKISPLINEPELLTNVAFKIQDYINSRFNMDILSQENITKVISLISRWVPSFLSTSASAMMNLFISFFLLWFLLINAKSVEIWLTQNLPFQPENRVKVMSEVKDSIKSNAIGLPIMGAIQGLIAIIGYWIFGVSDPVLWGIVTGICSFIPFIGTMAAWVPIAILSFANGEISNGIGLSFWGLIVIGMSDNVFRMLIQKKLGDTHPLITVFGVIVGLNMFGFWGLIFGPMIISLFLLLIRVYVNEFAN
jgi:predicted PurR-regulated permease PerM